MWTSKDFPSHMPWMDTAAADLQLQIYDNLVYKYHEDPDDVRGLIAESWETSDDGLVWTFYLRDGVKFSNGKDVTADCFVKTWDAAKPYCTRLFEVVEKYEALDDLTLQVTLSEPSPTFIYDLPMQNCTGVVDPELLEQYGPESNEAAVGAGPYYIDEYVSGDKIVLKANPYYSIEERMPCIETVTLEVIPEANTAMMAYMSDQIQCINTDNMEIVNNLRNQGYDLAKWSARCHPWWFNAKENELFQDAAVREALCHMIDWEAINELVYNGEFIVMSGYWDGGPGSVDYGDNYTYDPELGLQMLEDAGYALEDIDFTIVCNSDFVNQTTAIVAQFNELGLTNVDMETYDMATCLGMIKDGTYEVTTTHNGYSYESPLTPYLMGLPQDGSQRIIWLDYMDEVAYEEAMEHYNAALQCKDFESYEKEVEAITKIAQDNNCALGGLHRVGYYAVSENYSGVYIIPTLGYIDFCYLYRNDI